MYSKFRWLIIPLICFSAYALYVYRNKKPVSKKSLKTVLVGRPQVKSITDSVKLLGLLKARREASLVSDIAGNLDVVVWPGQWVKKDTLIAYIDNPSYHTQQSLVRDSEQIAKVQYERERKLFEEGIVSQSSVEGKRLEWIEAKRRQSTQKNQHQIKAPFDGMVGAFKLKEGAYINPGSVIATFYDPQTQVVDMDVPVSIVSKLPKTTYIQVLGKTYETGPIVHWVDSETLMTPLSVPIDCQECILGQTVEVELIIQKKEKALMLPESAVFLKQQVPTVYVVDQQGKVQAKTVLLGVRMQTEVEIIKGLEASDRVIVMGSHRVRPGTQVHTVDSL